MGQIWQISIFWEQNKSGVNLVAHEKFSEPKEVEVNDFLLLLFCVLKFLHLSEFWNNIIDK